MVSKKIIQFGPERTGSTLVCQILKRIFKDITVEKTHGYNYVPGSKVVITIRDPRDALVSLWMAYNSRGGKIEFQPIKPKVMINENFVNPLKAFNNTKMTKDDVIQFVEIMNNRIESFNSYLKNAKKEDILVLKYELFYQNFEYTFENLEKFFNITISHEDRDSILQECNLETNRKIASSLKDFSEYDPESLIHGDHIFDGKVNKWIKYIPIECHELISTSFKEFLIAWNYPLE